MEDKSKLIERWKKRIKQAEQILSYPYRAGEAGVDLTKLQREKEILKRLTEKLERNEFEVAIVGLEKAGKSSFANALIGSEIFPSAVERCTYTSAQLRYDPEDKAVIELYTREEFQKLFRSLLKELGYPKWEEADFNTFTVEELNRYLNQLNTTERDAKSKLIGEIEDIIKSKHNLELDGGIREFRGDRVYQQEFRTYITGEKVGDKVVNVGKPRSVKNIKIYSSKLKEFKNAVIYDVPGFDSPIFLHQQQTIERIQEADALILVSSLDKPNLNDSQLNMLRKSDADGIELSKKAFIFGNKLDYFKSDEDREKAVNTLKADAILNRVATEDKIFFGSARKYLLEKGIITPKRGESLEQYKDVPTGIEELRAKLEEYLREERVAILQRRGEEASRLIWKEAEKVIEWWERNYSEEELNRAKNRVVLQMGRRIEWALVRAIRKTRSDLKLKGRKVLEEELKKRIEQQGGLELLSIGSPIIEEAFTQIEGVTPLDNIEKYNEEIRKILTKEYLNRFNRIVSEIVANEVEGVIEQILTRFREELGEENPELIEVIWELISAYSHTQREWEVGFQFIIERFTRLLFDLLLETKYEGMERENKFRRHEKDLRFITYYLSTSEGKLEEKIGIKERSNSRSSSRSLYSTGKTTPGSHISQSSDSPSFFSQWGENREFKEVTDQILAEINRDIRNLKEILTEGTIPAISPDLLFLMIIDKDLLNLVNSIESGKLGEEIEYKIAKGIDLLKSKWEDNTAEIEQLKEWIDQITAP